MAESPSVPRHVKVWTPIWWNRSDDEPTVKCGVAEHFADTWFRGCEHQPTSYEFIESARALCDETRADNDILEVISRSYFEAWVLNDPPRHINQWPLALIVLGALREAGYDVVRLPPDEQGTSHG